MRRTGSQRTHRARRLVASVVLGALVLTGPPAPAQPAPAQPAPAQPAPPDGDAPADVEALRERYEELAGAEADVLVEYDLSGARLVDLVNQVAAARAAVDRAEAALRDAEADLATRREEEATAEAAARVARRQVARAEDRLRTHAVETYMDSGDTAAMGAVFDVIDGDAGPLARRGYRQSVSDQQRRLIDALVEARERRTRSLAAAARAADDAEAQRGRVDELRDRASTALDDVSRLVEEASAERERQEALLVELQSRKVSIEARITSLQKAADGIAALLAAFEDDQEEWVAGAVDVRLPLEGGRIGSEFGPRHHPILKVTRLHAGVDIGAPTGAPVLAAGNGIVIASGVRGGYGNTVVVSHGHSLSTVYAHNSVNEVEVGQIVEQGDVIARVGSTGLSTGPHIHFETRIKGVPVNPRSILTTPGDATWGKLDDDGDGIRNARDIAPDDPDVPVPNGDADVDGDGQPDGGQALGQPRQPR